ncbi:left-right determination factor 2-like [Acipenser oxyrinchus oxyrinchus]|uniref:Left-right determination factor n=1 Tax=Acipenser oxyrinchus oxyrinchus TaxID=40147 RepID=A0AAD8GBS4_ACIOX|nr:left-right determination factor 2-like [Acipenser oxyrinchus oxyrinchus]
MGNFTTWVLCAMLVVLVEGFTHEDMKDAMLKKLGLNEVPKIQKRDLENLVIPAHIKNKYMSMLNLHNARKRRSLPSLAGILRGIPGNADISGEILYSDTTRQRMVFDMEARIPENSEVTMAELKLFKKAPKKLPLPDKRSHRPVNNARVSVYWVEILADGSNRTSLVDSRLVPIHETGWKSFDVTQGVQYWLKTNRQAPMHLEIWIEGERPGSYAAEMAKCVQFTSQGTSGRTLGKPELVLYTLNLEEFGSRGDCEESTAKKNNVCCREEYFINFRELTWTQYWIIEPAGYQAFRCAGGCKQLKNPLRHYGYGERTCAVVESTPLPMMYLVKKGEYTEIEVAEFPNMIVEKCGCTMDNISVV